MHMMTENVKRIIMRQRSMLFTDETRKRYQLDERKVLVAATIPELDEAYTRWDELFCNWGLGLGRSFVVLETKTVSN